METAELKANIHRWVDEEENPERLEEIAALLRPDETPDPDEDTDEQVIENLREAFREMQRVERGESQARPASELLEELRRMKHEL